MTPRPLHTYRPQHDEDCQLGRCRMPTPDDGCHTDPICGFRRDDPIHDTRYSYAHPFINQACSCGLDHALALARSEGEPTGWQPIETAPRNRIKLYEQRAIGGWWHKVYGWLWGQLDFHPDKHHDDGGYFLSEGPDPN